MLPRKVRTNPVKTHAASPIFQPKVRAAVKSIGMPKVAISKSDRLSDIRRMLNSVCS